MITKLKEVTHPAMVYDNVNEICVNKHIMGKKVVIYITKKNHTNLDKLIDDLQIALHNLSNFVYVRYTKRLDMENNLSTKVLGGRRMLSYCLGGGSLSVPTSPNFNNEKFLNMVTSSKSVSLPNVSLKVVQHLFAERCYQLRADNGDVECKEILKKFYSKGLISIREDKLSGLIQAFLTDYARVETL